MSKKNCKGPATFLKSMVWQHWGPYVWSGNCIVRCAPAILQNIAREFVSTCGNMADSEVLVSAAYLVILNNKKRNKRPYLNK